MDKCIYNEKNGLWYELQGDYYLPCLKLPEEGEVHIGIWGQRHLRYLKQYHRVRYYNLLTSGKLNDYLVDVENWAQQMFDELVNALSRNENLTEGFKATNPVEWVRKSNNIRNRAAEIVNQEVVERKISVLPRETLLTYRKIWSKKVWRGSQMMS